MGILMGGQGLIPGLFNLYEGYKEFQQKQQKQGLSNFMETLAANQSLHPGDTSMNLTPEQAAEAKKRGINLNDLRQAGAPDQGQPSQPPPDAQQNQPAQPLMRPNNVQPQMPGVTFPPPAPGQTMAGQEQTALSQLAGAGQPQQTQNPVMKILRGITGGGQQQQQQPQRINYPQESIYSVGPEGLEKKGQVAPGSKVFQSDPYQLQGMKNEVAMAKMQLMQEGMDLKRQLAESKSELDREKLNSAIQLNDSKIKQLEATTKLTESKTGTQGMVANPNPGLTGEAAMANYTPEIQKLAKKMVAAEIPYPSSFALRDPQWKAVVQAATDLDPTWNASQHKIREQTRKSFTSGLDAKNITSINTLVGHLDSLNESAKGLDNKSIQAYNTVGNWVSAATGNPKVAKFNMDLGAVESELAAVFKQTGATDQEIKAWSGRINASQSPEQLKSVIHEAVELMGSRLSALKSKYDAGMGPFGQLQILSPKSRQTLEKLVGKEAVEGLEPQQEARPEAESKAGGREADKANNIAAKATQSLQGKPPGEYKDKSSGQTIKWDGSKVME